MLVVPDRRGERLEKRLHSCDVGVGQDQCERVLGAGLDGSVDAGEA